MEIGSSDGVSKSVLTVFGEPKYGDLDGDGDEDSALVLSFDNGGSGIFYYVALAARGANGGYTGTSAVLLGDRIAPQTLEIRNGRAIVNYAVRGEGEDFSVRPSFQQQRKALVLAF